MRFLCALMLVSAFCFPLSAQTDTVPQRKKVAVVLSGGGAKGVAHVTALKVIEEAGIPVDIVVASVWVRWSEVFILSVTLPNSWIALPKYGLDGGNQR